MGKTEDSKLNKMYRKVRKLGGKAYKFHMLRHVYPKLYHDNAMKPIDKKKAVFVEVREEELSSNFRYIFF